MKNPLSFAVAISCCIAMAGCAQTDLAYVTNAQKLLDTLDANAPKFVENIPLGADDRIAVINLDGGSKESGQPSEMVYDLLTTALLEKGLPVVERDAEGLYASIIESWSPMLPFNISAPCGKQCTTCPEPVKERSDDRRNKRDKNRASAQGDGGPTIVVQSCGSPGCGKDDDGCATCQSPFVAMPTQDVVKMVKELSDHKDTKEDECPKQCGCTPESATTKNPADVPIEARSYHDYLGALLKADWFDINGNPIVAEQAAATHVLGYRIMYFGTHLQPLVEQDDKVRRKVRIDLVMRLIRTSDGVVTWSDRLVFEEAELLPAEIADLLEDNPYTFSAVDQED